MTGVIVVDKPQGFTSFDIVALMRGMTREKRVGHAGTLDPMATGVLPILLGRATKAVSLLPDTDKCYEATFRLGERRDTGDITGAVLETDSNEVSQAVLEAVAKRFRGEIEQMPPMYSAVSVNGQRLYKLARQGIEVARPKRRVQITQLAIKAYDPATRSGTMAVTCSKGTYIRVLIEDIAKAAGTCGTMTALRRTAACGFQEQAAVPLEALREMGQEALGTLVRPVDTLFSDLPRVAVSQAQAKRFQNGGGLDIVRLKGIQDASAMHRVYAPDGLFLGLGMPDADRAVLKVEKLFAL